jgi:hypothetical protein
LSLTTLTNQISACAIAKAGIDLCSKISIPGESDFQQAVAFACEKQTFLPWSKISEIAH